MRGGSKEASVIMGGGEGLLRGRRGRVSVIELVGDGCDCVFFGWS
ncbi:MAG: hypothetical protein NZ530_01655 [Thermodesulfobacteriaceae bacterium]|nr:hypothetical protein [Thermodesulfobacteriaceae bacterium]